MNKVTVTSHSDEVNAYIASFPQETQEKLEAIRKVIREAAPEATEKMSYKMPTYYFKGNLVHFAAMKNHIGFYPTPSAIEFFSEKLKDYKTSKGAVQFPYEEEIPYALIREIVYFRLEENAKK